MTETSTIKRRPNGSRARRRKIETSSTRSRSSIDHPAERRRRHDESIAKILGEAQAELDRRRAVEKAKVEAFELQLAFAWNPPDAFTPRLRPVPESLNRLRDADMQAHRDNWNFRDV